MELARGVLFSLLFAFRAAAEPLGSPSPEDMTLLSSAIASQLLDSESMRLSDVLSAPDATSSSMNWICGSVQGKNGFGGYAQPSPFLAMLVDDPLIGARKVQLLKIASDERQAKLAGDICKQKFDLAIAVHEAGSEVAGYLREHSSLAMICNFEGTGSASCNQRDDLTSKLKEQGWCLDQGTRDDWRRC